MNNQNKDFRKDINGLRAWAVVAVILFHFNVPGFSGGFVGVDIFFVISGYLMTGIITRGLQNNNFSFASFYISRARRILPALLVLCLVLLIVAWFTLSPIQLKQHIRHTTSAALFFSNIKFLNEAGYFDTASHYKLLLHTWSLSVEWQFYLILPLILGLVWKLSPSIKSLTFILITTFFISLGFSIYQTQKTSSIAFYLLHTRAWEMLAGGLVFLTYKKITINNKNSKIIEIIGFSLVVLSLFIFNKESNWPGWEAIVPVVGAVLIILAGRTNSFLTNNFIVLRLGAWSFSLYLWHWPIAALLVQMDFKITKLTILICLFLTLILGWLSYRFIEKPTQNYFKDLSKKINIFAITISLIIMAIFIFTAKNFRDSTSRMPEKVAAIFNEIENRNPRDKECNGKLLDSCKYGGNTLGAIVIGDSHAASLVRSVEKAFPSKELHILDWSKDDCPTDHNIDKVSEAYTECSVFIKTKLEETKNMKLSTPIIIINRTSAHLFGGNEDSNLVNNSDKTINLMRNGIIETACEFAKYQEVYMLRPIPELKLNVPETMGKALWYKGKHREVSISLEEYHQRHAFVWALQDEAVERCGIKTLNPLPYLCNEGKCKGDFDGLPIYYDDDHLNERGGQLLIPLFKRIFNYD